MAGESFFDKYEEVAPGVPAPKPPPTPKKFYDAYEPVTTARRPAVGFVENVQAGWQGSAPGLMWRGKLPNLFTDPDTASWWERAAATFTHVGAELPMMIGGAIAGGPPGAAAGTAVAGPAGTFAGGLIGAGFGMGVVPATIRTSLTEAYKAGEAQEPADWFNIVREVAKQALKEGGINAAAMGAGAVAARVVGSAIAPAVGQKITAKTFGAGVEAADLTTQIAAMVTMPAVIDQRLPKAHEFLDAAILIGGLKAAHVTASRVMHIYQRTGKTPAEQVADAKTDPAIAAEITRSEATAEAIVPREATGEVRMPTIQEALFRETARLTALEEKAGGTMERKIVDDFGNEVLIPGRPKEFLSDTEKNELSILRERVKALERGDPAGIVVSERPSYTPDQMTEVQAKRETRLAELEAKTQALTDSERAERVFLTNATPEALARRFGIEAVERKPLTMADIETGARKIHDDVLKQLRDVDEARRDAGLTPLGDEHAQQVAALVMARVRTRAVRLGLTPEQIFGDRTLRIRDAATAEVQAAEAAIPTSAPRFELPPEVDLFGNPVEAPMVPRFAVENLETKEIPLANLILSKEVPQFKHAADEKGVIVPLGGKFDRTGVGPIQVWERLDGTLEVISGRHRLDLARRSGEETIPAQVHREADGFDARQAATLDAQLNIREEQGSVADYAQYFKDSGLSKEAADERGLLARAKGRTGFAIARDGTPDLIAANRAGVLSDEAALSISVAAPGSDRLQALGIAMVNEGKSILVAVNMMKAVDLMAAERMAKGAQGDIFGFDDSAMQEAAKMAKLASSAQRKIGEQIAAVSGASKRPELAKKMGVDVQDPDGIQKRIVELRQEQTLWDNWPLHPELVARLRAPEVTGREGDLKQGPKSDSTPLESGPFKGVTKEQFLGDARITKRSNAADLRPKAINSLANVDGVPFKQAQYGDRFQAKYHENGSAVFEGEKVVASYDFGDTLVVDKKYRRLGIAEELVYQWRTRNPESKPAKDRTEVAQDIQEKVWDRIQTEADRNVLRQEEFSLAPETPAELAARNAEALAQAKRKLAEEAPGGPRGRALTPQEAKAQADLFSTQQTLFQSGPAERWYSELGRQVEAAKMNQAPAQGWKDWLRGLKGVKADEIKWSGIEEWLDLQEGKVTKEQVSEYLRGNGVKVEEHVRGAPGEAGLDVIRERLRRDGYDIREDMTGEMMYRDRDGEMIDFEMLPERLQDFINRHAPEGGERDTEHATKFGQYQLPGAKEGSYRELLLTLPGKEPNLTAREAGARDSWIVREENSGQEWEVDGKASAAEAMREVQDKQGHHLKIGNAFTSSHFDEPNILAHVRFNERTDAEGKRVLFVEEIQSDWAAKGRKEGFVEPNFEQRIKELQDLGADATTEQRQELQELQGKAFHKVPAAPFVGKTDAWVALTLKRMIRYAAENGMDRVAWTTGEQQVSRYTNALRHAVDAIEWTKTPEGVQLVGYKGKAGSTLTATRNAADDAIIRNDYLGFDTPSVARAALVEAGTHWPDKFPVKTAADRRAIQKYIDEWKASASRNKVVDTTEKEDVLSDAIGKSMADKIRNDPAQSGTIEGENIKIDDTGMATFYDRIVPNVAKDVLKKLGGGKVTETKVPGAEPERGKKLEGPFDSEQEARRFAEAEVGVDWTVQRVGGGRWNVYEAKPGKDTTSQQSFEITPAMRDKAMEGLPLFQQERGSYNIAEKLITTFERADKSTVIHELGHDWLQEMKEDAARPDAPAQIKADWEQLRQEFAIPAEGDIPRASHEQFARTVERYTADGEAPSVGLRAVFERFKAWMLEIYQTMLGLGVKINPEVKEILDRMLATDQEIADAKGLGVPRAYVNEAKENVIREIVPGFKSEQVALEPYADELPKGPGEAPSNSHVNYDGLDSAVKIKLTLQRLAEIDQQNVQKARGGKAGVETWQEEQAAMEGWILETLGGGADRMKLLKGSDPNDPKTNHRLRAMKQMMVGAGHESEKLRDVILEKGHNATIEEQLQYLSSIELLRQLHAEFLGERAAVARAMNALKDTTEGSAAVNNLLAAIGRGADPQTLFQSAAEKAMADQAMLKAKLDEILLRYNGKSVLDIAKLHKEIGTLKGTFKLAETIERATTWEMVVEGWKAALLSGPVTHTTNLFGTGAFQSLRAPVDALAAVIGMARGASPGMGESDRASMSEAVARVTGMLGGVGDGLKAGRAAFDLEPTGKTESYREAIPGRAGELIRIPLRLMGAEDAIVSTMYKRGEIATLAIRQAFDEGLNPGTREFAERVETLKQTPTPAMELAADQAATRMTFNMPLGEKGVALQLFVNKWNLQWMIPFIRTPINITKEVARMSPFAPLVGEWRADIAKGGVARDRALAETALGTGIMALTMAYAFAGQITGSGGPDPGKNRGKAGVEQPMSILIGDTWYEYARIQPVGTLMGLAADMAIVWDHMTDEEKDKVPKLLARAFSNAVTNQTFLQGITNVINAMSEPARFAPKFVQQLAGSLVPNIIGQPITMADPYVREVNSAMEAIQARLPGRQDMMPKRDWLGETVETKERLGVVGPVRTMKVSEDKVRLEAARLDISMAAAPKKTHIGKGTGKLGDVELTPEERNKFQEVGGQMAHRILAQIVNSPGYDKMPPLVQKQIFSRVLTASHRMAAVAALPMDKRVAYLQSITEKVAQELAPVTE